MDPNALWKSVCLSLQALHTYPDNPYIRAESLDKLTLLMQWLVNGGFPPQLGE